MTAVARSWRLALFASAAVGLCSCGGGSSNSSASSSASPPPPSGPNVVTMVVDSGPKDSSGNPIAAVINQAYVTIKICVPGSTTSCQTLDHIWVDTGSTGLRLFTSSFASSLPLSTDGSGNAIGSCSQFLGAYTWGALRSADITVGGKTAASVPIQVIGDSGITTIAPSTCSNGSGGALQTLDTAAAMGANGLLGIGEFKQDCGPACASTTPPNPPTGWYYICPAGSCTQTSLATNLQMQNPVSLFATDNNGVLVQLQSIAAGGAGTASGYLIFGINTQSNNMLGSALVFAADTNNGTIRTTTTYGDMSEPSSFIDSGSNGYFFNGPTSLTACPGTPPNGFYCPSSTVSLSATMLPISANTPSFAFGFNIASASSFSSTTYAANDLGGPDIRNPPCDNTNPANLCSFDWGLPFFYGRSVFTAIEGAAINGNATPFFAASTP
jgi:hypothetical protein